MTSGHFEKNQQRKSKMNEDIPKWKVELENKETYFYSGETKEIAEKLFKNLFGVTPLKITPSDGWKEPVINAPHNPLVQDIERERFYIPSLKVIVAGSRTVQDMKLVEAAIKGSGFRVVEVVSGTASGVDTLGEEWAKKNDVPIKRFPADWKTHGKKAGMLRNTEMAEYADALVAIIENDSRGTANMIETATKKGLRVYKKIV